MQRVASVESYRVRLQARSLLAVLVCAAVWSLSLGWLASAHAQPLPAQLQLDWSGPASCPRTSLFDAELSRLLGATAARIEPGEVDIDVRTLAEGRYRLSLEVEVAQGASERVLELASCDDLQRVAALLIATALELAGVHVPEPPPAPRAAQRETWSLQLGALADFGSLPGLTAGPRAGVAYTQPWLRSWLDARYLLARDRADGDSQAVARVDLFAAALGVARLWTRGALALGPTLELELGYLRARGRGEDSRAGGAGWGSTLLGALAEYDTGRGVALALTAQLSAPLWRPGFGLEGEDAFYRTRPVAFRSGFGLRVPLGFKKTRAPGQ